MDEIEVLIRMTTARTVGTTPQLTGNTVVHAGGPQNVGQAHHVYPNTPIILHASSPPAVITPIMPRASPPPVVIIPNTPDDGTMAGIEAQGPDFQPDWATDRIEQSALL